MAAKTVHVYPSNGAWAVKREGGGRGETFGTKREAVEVAVRKSKKAGSAQLVIHGKDGQILDHRRFRLPKVQDPPKKGSIGSKEIAKAVSKVVLERLRRDPPSPREDTTPK